MTRPILSLRHEWSRLLFRFEILWRALVTASLWLAVLALYTALEPVGLAGLVTGALILLAIVGAPVLLVQAALLVDLATRLCFGFIAFYPRMMKLVEESDRRTPAAAAAEPPRWMRILVWTVDALSPLSAPTVWAFVVAARMPPSAHWITAEYLVPRETSIARELRRFEGRALNRTWHGGFAAA